MPDATSLVSKLDDAALCAAVDLLVYPQSKVYCIHGQWYRTCATPSPGRELSGISILYDAGKTVYGTLCTRWFDEARFNDFLRYARGYVGKPRGSPAAPFRYSLGIRNTVGSNIAYAEFARANEAPTLVEKTVNDAIVENAMRRCLLEAAVTYHEGWLVFTYPPNYEPGLSDHGVTAVNGPQHESSQAAVEAELNKLEADQVANEPPSRSPRRVIITVPATARTSLLLEGDSPEAHRGVWFYDPALYGDIAAGDTVIFESNNEELVVAGVTGRVKSTDNERKFCSGVNSAGFFWLPAADKAELDKSLSLANAQELANAIRGRNSST